ncbi:MAG: T9SS type A sorting domain-containing protein [Bacteroidota bacterium]
MKKILLTSLCLITFTSAVIAQVSVERFVLASAGGSYSNGSTLSLDYTIGEVAVTTVGNGSNILTQGFQQPFTNVLVSVPENTSRNLCITAGPNPARDNIDIRINSTAGAQVTAQLYDVLGRMIRIQSGNTDNSGILKLDFEVSNLATGYYYLTVRTGFSEKSIKILKISP